MKINRGIIEYTILFLLLFATSVNVAAKSIYKSKNITPTITTPKLNLPKPNNSIEKILFKYPSNIPSISNEINYSNFYEMPDEYKNIWSNYTIDPYNFSVAGFSDTLRIDISNYTAPTNGKITSDWGFRRAAQFHYGIDLKVYTTDTIKAAFDGTVRITRYNRGGYGYFVVIRHNNGLETLYGHLSKILVKDNTKIKSGEAIGMGGNTGRSTGSHLHLEFRYLGVPINPHSIANFTTTYKQNSDILYVSSDTFEYKKEVDKIRYWTIRSGDTLGRIAYRTGVSVSKLCALNGIRSTSILRLGQRIRYN